METKIKTKTKLKYAPLVQKSLPVTIPLSICLLLIGIAYCSTDITAPATPELGKSLEQFAKTSYS